MPRRRIRRDSARALPRTLAGATRYELAATLDRFVDYVEAGKIIPLNAQDSIVLSYLYSCVRETISGGVITVGKEQSEVRSGKVVRALTPCDAGRMIRVGHEYLSFIALIGSLFIVTPTRNAGNYAPVSNTTRNRAFPLIIRSKASGALSSGYFSISAAV